MWVPGLAVLRCSACRLGRARGQRTRHPRHCSRQLQALLSLTEPIGSSLSMGNPTATVCADGEQRAREPPGAHSQEAPERAPASHAAAGCCQPESLCAASSELQQPGSQPPPRALGRDFRHAAEWESFIAVSYVCVHCYCVLTMLHCSI